MQSVTRFSPERQVGETPTERFPPILVERGTRSMLAGRLRQVVRFAMDAITDMARGSQVDQVTLGVIEAALLDALEALRSIRTTEPDRPF